MLKRFGYFKINLIRSIRRNPAHFKKRAMAASGIFLVLFSILFFAVNKRPELVTSVVPALAATTQPVVTKPVSYKIANVPVLSQEELMAGCETYACTMLLQYYNFKTDEFDFSDNYLICSPISYDEFGTRYGPDMNSAFSGTVYNGYGIYAPAMAKSMNKFFEAKKSNLKATALEGADLDELCEEYVLKDKPVMVWATTHMEEPYEKASWVVDFVDENAKTKIGDTTSWMQNEHCLLLVGFDDKNYYFNDSVAGGVSVFSKKLVKERYAQIGSMTIVVE